MADMKLGPSGSEITLPIMKWLEGNQPDLPVSIHKQIEERRMSDGSLKWAFFKKKREWPRAWGYLSKAELDVFIGLYDLNQILRFQDNNESATWYEVVMISLRYGPVRTDILDLQRYWCEIILREA